MHDLIYLDNNATTPIDKRVLKHMLPYLKDYFANETSSYYLGSIINEAINRARTQVADLIGAERNEIIFTSGATEAINIALKGLVENYSLKGKHILTVSTEHKAVLETCKYLETIGYEVTYLPVKEDGLIDLDILKKSLRSDTILVSVMHVNNETGVIQPIKEIASIAHDAGAFFLTDATQSAGKIEIDVNELEIDLLALSGHKIYGTKGIGALYIRQYFRPVKITTYTHGGGQEKNIRSGTLNVPGIIALGKACEISQLEMEQDAKQIRVLRDKLEEELLKIPKSYINGNTKNRIYNVTNICFPNINSNVLIGKIKKLAISNGSACNSALLEPSYVLKAMSRSDEDALSSIRLSLGRFNTLTEVRKAVKILYNELINSIGKETNEF